MRWWPRVLTPELISVFLFQMHSAGLLPKDPAFSVSVGVAALILEGRPHHNNSHAVTASSGGSGGGGGGSNSDEDETGAAEALLVAEYARGRNLIKDAAQRINQKLQAIRTCPGTSKECVENASFEISVGSPSSMEDYAEKIYVNPKFRSNDYGFQFKGGVSGGSGSSGPYGKPTTRSLFKTVEAWTESNIIYNGLEKIKMLHNRSPIKTANGMKVGQPAVGVVGSGIKKKPTTSAQGPLQGPHCEQFLKKIGLVKVDPGDDIDHKCEYLSDMVRCL